MFGPYCYLFLLIDEQFRFRLFQHVHSDPLPHNLLLVARHNLGKLGISLLYYTLHLDSAYVLSGIHEGNIQTHDPNILFQSLLNNTEYRFVLQLLRHLCNLPLLYKRHFRPYHPSFS